MPGSSIIDWLIEPMPVHANSVMGMFRRHVSSGHPQKPMKPTDLPVYDKYEELVNSVMGPCTTCKH